MYRAHSSGQAHHVDQLTMFVSFRIVCFSKNESHPFSPSSDWAYGVGTNPCLYGMHPLEKRNVKYQFTNFLEKQEQILSGWDVKLITEFRCQQKFILTKT